MTGELGEGCDDQLRVMLGCLSGGMIQADQRHFYQSVRRVVKHRALPGVTDQIFRLKKQIFKVRKQLNI